ncbi:nucleotide exchange factor GrpE [Algoriphagus lutimaris]|uniref:nucleotide exchange factor GrpE n=1 Tax=Algoriphagus lutimaris TaxID=613197 RepID=UPI00196B4C8C|nr:nucleotide exchange factor GrpE [Algoriphagus lutimaris]MBN3520536.1 nucleotide exchange factor GrpE [Algoriphagus lutimaris]
MKNKEHEDKEMDQSEEQLVKDSPEEQVSSEDLGKEEVVSVEEKLTAEVADLKDKYLRLYSDFENFRKRTSKERLDLITTASEEVLRDLIPVVDDFERSLKVSGKQEENSKEDEGNFLIYQKLMRILESKGLKPMEDLVGKPFDADTQEAITQIPAPTEELSGKVIDVVEKGYTLGDKVVRFAKVVTGA